MKKGFTYAKNILSLILVIILGLSAFLTLMGRAEAVDGSGPNITIPDFGVSVGDSGWKNSVSANPGDELWFQLQVHNTNVPSDAENLTVKLDMPTDRDGNLTVNVTAGTSSPTTVAGSVTSASKSVTVNIPGGARLKYRAGSMQITWDQNGDGTKEYSGSAWGGGDGSLTGSGVNFGTLKGCNNYVIQLLFAADVVKPGSPSLSIEKKVAFGGREESTIEKSSHIFGAGEKVVYRLFISNNGDADALKVTIKDNMPPYIKWLEGDGSNDGGANRIDFDLGTLKAKETRTVGYTAKVVDNVPAGETSQDNVAKLYEDGQERGQGRAFVTISGATPTPTGMILAAATELPVSGGGEVALIIAGIGSALAVGRLLMNIKSPSRKHYENM